MTVYTYFDQCAVSATAAQTLELWKSSWSQNGWHPVVLDETVAARHPLYPKFSEAIKNLPSVNPSGFDYHAFMRWLAVAALPDTTVVTTEPDVINYSLGPIDLGAPEQGIEIHSPVPAFLVGRPEAFGLFCAQVAAHSLTEQDNFQGMPHLSDQDFAARYGTSSGVTFVHHSPFCAEAFADGWETSPCVHYGTPYMLEHNKMPKHEWIPQLRLIV